MLSVSPNCVTRSSLEEMLESLRQRDEIEKSKDVPPALPARPKPTSRARLPSVKRPLPTSFEVGESETGQSSLDCNLKKGETKDKRGSSFGAKKVKEVEPGESPYVVVASDREGHELRSEEKDNAKLANLPLGSQPKFRESKWDDNIGYFVKKVDDAVRFFCLIADIHKSLFYSTRCLIMSDLVCVSLCKRAFMCV
ncbi:hypothetical protein CDL12_09423 [Handroanthus impetiginosus]|uniref:Uncharacterized protein n=1 Tax=Handroanthus impetiginosus TaxID=429701 RepID=A0A2G9HK52_9LAMI|nr:hypothetical protein CDL12_09423 [Handroanthus impetiginosus]